MDNFVEAEDCKEKDELTDLVSSTLPKDVSVKVSQDALDGFKKMKEEEINKTWEDIIKKNCSTCVFSKEFDTSYDDDFHLKVEAWKADYGTDDGRNGYLYVRIVCNKPLELSLWKAHPFWRLGKDYEGKTEYGEIIADNDYVRTLLHWICLPDEELEGKVGSCGGGTYRMKLIGQVHGLWD